MGPGGDSAEHPFHSRAWHENKVHNKGRWNACFNGGLWRYLLPSDSWVNSSGEPNEDLVGILKVSYHT
jgi:hypothetical protein